MDLKQLKAKYSGQPVPEWELEAAGLKVPVAADAEPPKRRGRPPKAVAEPDEPEGE